MEPFEVDLYPYFPSFSEIIVEIQAFLFISVFEFVNLNLNGREWQIIFGELESLHVKILLQT